MFQPDRNKITVKMGRKMSSLFRRSKSKAELIYTTEKPYAECVANRSALATENRQDDSQSRASSRSRRSGPTTVSAGKLSEVQMPLGVIQVGPDHIGHRNQSSISGSMIETASASGGSSNFSTAGRSIAQQSTVSVLSNGDQSAFDARKLVIQYFLQDAEATFEDNGRRQKIGAGMAVKVKARVEVSFLCFFYYTSLD